MPHRTALASPLIVVFFLVIAACGSGETEVETAAEAPPQEVFQVDPSVAAAVSGTILFAGEAPKLVPINMGGDEDCKATQDGPVYPETVAVNENGTLKNVFVFVTTGLEDKAFEVPAEPVRIDQTGCAYVPHVVGIQVGQTLEVSNSDPTLHNVHPLPRSNSEWNKSQAAGAGVISETFSKPELMIPVKCNIHPWMRAYVNVSNHPFFAITDEMGAFSIEGLPPGDYTLQAVHARFGTQDFEISVAAGESGTAEFTFGK
jgi:plastocyanin